MPKYSSCKLNTSDKISSCIEIFNTTQHWTDEHQTTTI